MKQWTVTVLTSYATRGVFQYEASTVGEAYKRFLTEFGSEHWFRRIQELSIKPL
jgi:hypothetical protein